MQASRFILLLSLVCIVSGCGYKRLRVMVYDMETEKPVEGAEVVVNYPRVLDPFAPRPVSATTDARGVADLKVADRTTNIRVSHGGYGVESRHDRTWYLIDKDGNKVDRLKARAGDTHVHVCWLSRYSRE